MQEFRNICLIDTPPVLETAFKFLGYTALTIRTEGVPLFRLPDALDAHGFKPDLVLQRETLADRCVLIGLDELDCPLMFWAVDPHLNAHWHSAYAHLFDMTCSTQRGWIPRIKDRGAKDVRWLPIFGSSPPWVDMKDRAYDLGFVGRVSDQRPARKWMLEFLENKCVGFNLAIKDNLQFKEMLDLYLNSKIVPNESIFGEVNFRLFEAASCGCLVLNQNLGDEQEALFEPGREMDTYSDVVELDDKLAMYLKNDRLVQAMGRAARERIQREHLPQHRAKRILEYAKDAVRNRATGVNCAKWTAMTAFALWEGGQFVASADEILSMLAPLSQDEDVAEASLRVQSMAGKNAVVKENIQTILGGQLYTDSLTLNLTGSMAALRCDHWDAAKTFWYRHIQSTGNTTQTPPKDPVQLLTLWGKELKRQGRAFRAGFSFEPSTHLPGSAMECLMLILEGDPNHLPTLRLLASMLKPVVGLEQNCVGFLSILTLHERNDWRLAFEIAFANLKSYRFDSGLEELQLAREVARKNGQEKDFKRALAARDKTGLIAKKLG